MNRFPGVDFVDFDSLLTEEQRSRFRQPQRVQETIPPTHADVKYGPHERNVMDVWLAKSDKPTPVLVSIHGGGFQGLGPASLEALERDVVHARGVKHAYFDLVNCRRLSTGEWQPAGLVATV